MAPKFRIQFGVVVIIFLATVATIHAQVATPAPGGNTTDSSNNATASTGKKKDPRLTGDPRKDYIYDPNLPRELNGYNLSYYPFYPLVPEDINFTCVDRHDGYYASIPHHCQLFHYCVVGVRYDFLCANYTVFDQTQFICQYVNIVNCGISEKYYDKNNDLYEPWTTVAPEEERPRRRYKNRSKKRTTTSNPEYYDEEYYDYEEEPATTRRPKPNRQKPLAKDVAADTQTDPEIVAEEPLPEEQEQVQQPAPRPKIRPPRPVKIRSKAQVSTSTEEVPAADTNPQEADSAYDYETPAEDPIPKEPSTPVEEVPPPQPRRPASRTRGEAERRPAEQDSATLEEESRVPPSRGRAKPKVQADEELATPAPSRNVEEKSAPAPPRRRTTTPAAAEEHLVEEEQPVEEDPLPPPPRRPTASRRVAIPDKVRTTTVAPQEEHPRPPRPVAVARPRLGRPKVDVAPDEGSPPLEPEYVDKQLETKVQVPSLPSEGPAKVRVVQRRRKTTTVAPKTTTVSEYADYEQV